MDTSRPQTDAKLPPEEEFAAYLPHVRRRWLAEKAAAERRRVAAWQAAREAATLLRDQFGAKRVIAFGSRVHPGYFSQHSDIDLAVAGIPAAAFFLDSVAINLHGFYNAVERILELLAREVDGGVPSGPAWHRELLTQMALKVPGVRPAVIREETANALGEYLRFRHIVRNLYTWNLAEAKLAELVSGLTALLADLRADLDAFGRYLEAASRADESPG